jgi:hypothetical protein
MFNMHFNYILNLILFDFHYNFSSSGVEKCQINVKDNDNKLVVKNGDSDA